MKHEYERPIIRKLHGGLMNKFGYSPAYVRKVRDNIDGATIASLVERFGSPLFVYSERTLNELYRKTYKAFSTRYPNIVFGWSYKTNYLQAICALMHRNGAIAEVVSEMEYQKARNAGIPGEKIIFNGPYKPLAVLTQAATDGALINLDTFDEIADVEAIAAKLGKRINVGIRLNLDAGVYPQWSRFGFNLENGQALDAARRIASGGKLALNTLHCHLGTFVLDPDAYARQVEKMAAFSYELEKKLQIAIDCLDLGGGLPSRCRQKGSYLPAELGVPSIETYAEKIGDALSRSLRPGDFPRVVLEAGRALIDEAGFLITTVVAVKVLPDSTRAYVADAGVNLLPTAFWYNFNIELERTVPGINEHSVIFGPLCMNIDVISDAASLPPLTRGARLIFSPVGAYSNTQWNQFISLRPNVVLVGEKGEVDVIREAEDLSDVERREKMPARLTTP